MTQQQRAVMQQALEALIYASSYCDTYPEIESLRQLLEQPEPVQEPVAPEAHLLEEAKKYWKHANAKHYGAVQWIENNETGELLIYTRGEYRKTLMANIPRTIPPAQPTAWVGLNAGDLAEIPPSAYMGAIWADAKLREKNGGAV